MGLEKAVKGSLSWKGRLSPKAEITWEGCKKLLKKTQKIQVLGRVSLSGGKKRLIFCPREGAKGPVLGANLRQVLKAPSEKINVKEASRLSRRLSGSSSLLRSG